MDSRKQQGEVTRAPLALAEPAFGFQSRGFELSYLEKVSEVKDTVHRQSLLHHLCHTVVERFPQTSDLYSEIAAITRSAKVRRLSEPADIPAPPPLPPALPTQGATPVSGEAAWLLQAPGGTDGHGGHVGTQGSEGIPSAARPRVHLHSFLRLTLTSWQKA